MNYQYIEMKNFIYCDPLDFLRKEKFIIYHLVDPADNQIRYIGQTTNGIKRITNHFSPSFLRRKSYKNSWIKSVQARGQKPIVLITHKENSQNELNMKERELIATFNHCVNLCNIEEGGGSKVPINADSRIKPVGHGEKIRKWYVDHPEERECRSVESKQRWVNDVYKNIKPFEKMWNDPIERENAINRIKGRNKKAMISLRDSDGIVYESMSSAAKAICSSTSNIRKHLDGRLSHVKGHIFVSCLDGIVKGDTAQVQKYIADCLAVKAKYPKP